MTIIDLRLEYKQDTADQNTPISNEPYINEEYEEWLERQLLFIRNTLCINKRALIKLEEMKDEL